jgi:hypothetical protein
MRCEEVDVDSLVPWVSIGYAMMLDDTLDARDAGELPDGQFVDVRYADLMTDPVGTMRAAYAGLGVEPPPDLDQRVTAHLVARPKDARGPHRYSLADTGLDETTERARFRRYQERYGVPDET